jgi:glycosyltransferase involved in cell wall biosynthesis
MSERRSIQLQFLALAKPLVSVIVSAYNRPELLALSLASVCNQTYGTLEIIVQDDSTNDECAMVVLAAGDSRVHYTHNVPALGTAANLLAGYRKATGTYFCTLNDDDLYAPDYIEHLVEKLESDANLCVAFSDQFIIDADGAILAQQTEQNTREWHRETLSEGIIHTAYENAIVHKSIPAMLSLFRRDVIDFDDFPAEVAAGYDFWLTYLAVRNGGPIYYTPDRLTYYRSHDKSQTAALSNPSNRLAFARSLQFMHTRFLSDVRLTSIRAQLIVKLAQDYQTAGFALLRLNQRGDALKELTMSLRKHPTWRAIAGLVLSFTPTALLKCALQARNPDGPGRIPTRLG